MDNLEERHREGETGVRGFPERVGRGMGVGCIAVFMLLIHCIPIALFTWGVNIALQNCGAIADLQTTVFSLIIALNIYAMYMFQCQNIETISRGVGRDLIAKRVNAKLDTILALVDDLENPPEK